MGMDILHCQSVTGVLKEMAVYAMVYNLARLVMIKAAGQQGTSVSSVSFCGRVALARSRLPGVRALAPDDQSPPARPCGTACPQAPPQRVRFDETTP